MDHDAEGMLHLLAAEPSLLDPAPAVYAAADLDRRVHDEVHACLRCGARATTALIAHTSEGPRWLDLCWTHYDDVRRTASP